MLSFYPISLDDNQTLSPIELCAIRAKVFTNGVFLALGYQNSYSSVVYQNIKSSVLFLLNKLETAKQLHLNDYCLTNELSLYIQKLSKITGLSVDEICLAESFWSWLYYKRPHLISISTFTYNQQKYFFKQTEVFRNTTLTLAQQQEWLKILNLENSPQWFESLPVWAKKLLRKEIQTCLETGNWLRIEQFMPTSLRRLPGLANVTEHQFECTVEGKIFSFHSAMRYGVFVPYEIHAPSEKKELCKQNIQQFMSTYLEHPKLQEDMRKYWGLTVNNVFEEGISPLSLLINLLSSIQQGNYKAYFIDGLGLSGKENNTKLTELVTSALGSYLENNKKKLDTKLMHYNYAVNQCRGSTPLPIPQQFLDNLKMFFSKIKCHSVLLEKIEILGKSIDSLEYHNGLKESKSTIGRNKNIFSAALMDVAVRLSGGLSAGNCKSSKDRKGIEFLYADAMLAYFQVFNEFPCYDAIGLKRQQFLEICRVLFLSNHLFKVVYQNNPGTYGLKDESIMDKDLVLILGKEYHQSKKMADYNKPYTIVEKNWNNLFKLMIKLTFIAVLPPSVLILSNAIIPCTMPFVFFGSFKLTSLIVILASAFLAVSAVMLILSLINRVMKGASLDELISLNTKNPELSYALNKSS